MLKYDKANTIETKLTFIYLKKMISSDVLNKNKRM